MEFRQATSLASTAAPPWETPAFGLIPNLFVAHCEVHIVGTFASHRSRGVGREQQRPPLLARIGLKLTLAASHCPDDGGTKGRDMPFSDKYALLESKFQKQVERDNRELGIKSSYVHNFIPPSPVDYVLIAMEPSTGVPGKDRKSPSQIARNFSWSVEDFILHYCVREYLCQSGETYHLTDLAKGGMKTKFAGKQRQDRYDRWYPLLEEELRLLTKPEGTRTIAIGKVVAEFLKKKSLCEHVERVLHYTRTAASHRNRVIQPWREQFSEFSHSVDKDSFQESIKEVLNDAGMDSYINNRPEGGKPYILTDSRKKLMFYYKNRFSELRDKSRIGLNFGDNRDDAPC